MNDIKGQRRHLDRRIGVRMRVRRLVLTERQEDHDIIPLLQSDRLDSWIVSGIKPWWDSESNLWIVG